MSARAAHGIGTSGTFLEVKLSSLRFVERPEYPRQHDEREEVDEKRAAPAYVSQKTSRGQEDKPAKAMKPLATPRGGAWSPSK
jgi:hypothetical protein